MAQDIKNDFAKDKEGEPEAMKLPSAIEIGQALTFIETAKKLRADVNATLKADLEGCKKNGVNIKLVKLIDAFEGLIEKCDASQDADALRLQFMHYLEKRGHASLQPDMLGHNSSNAVDE